jgi:hypothetical protein
MNYNNFETLEEAVSWMQKHQGMFRYRNLRLQKINQERWRFRVFFDR